MSTMASTSALRSSRAASILAASSSKSILKRASRPSPLPLSPGPFPMTSFNSVLSVPSSRSPHVHFPPSPGLISRYTTHSPGSYDRGPYPTSPSSNPNVPEIVSPTLNGKGTGLSNPPKRKTKKAAASTKPSKPTVIEEHDPRSPRPALMAGVAPSLAQGRNPRAELHKALTKWPRSPYPSAPISPTTEVDLADVINNNNNNNRTSEYDHHNNSNDTDVSGWAGRKRSNTLDGVINTARLARPPRALFVDERNTYQRGVTFKLTSSRRLAPPHLDLSAAKVMSYLAPVQEAEPVAELDNELTGVVQDRNGSDAGSSAESIRLSNAFWESMSLDVEDGDGMNSGGGGGGGVSARFGSEGEFPESVTGSQVSDSEERAVFVGGKSGLPVPPSLMSPRPPPEGRVSLLFGRNDGSVWSPCLLQESEGTATSSMSSPLGMHLHLGVARSTFTAPSPKDPFAKFPSFSAALKMDSVDVADAMVRPPPRALLA